MCIAVSQGRELLSDLISNAESLTGYAERAVAHIAAGLLQLSAAETSADETSEAKNRLSKALKLAHGRLQNYQMVSQVLLFMAPLQVCGKPMLEIRTRGSQLFFTVCRYLMLTDGFAHSSGGVETLQPTHCAGAYTHLAPSRTYASCATCI